MSTIRNLSSTNDGLANNPLFTESSTALYPLGTRYENERGVWVYSKASAAITQYNTVTTTAVVGVDTVANGTAAYMGVNGTSYGTTRQIVDAGAGFGAAGTYTGYYGIVDDGTGEGAQFVIDEHVSTSVFLVTFNNGTSGVTLDVSDSDITIFHPDSVKQGVVNSQTPIVGVAPIGVTSGYYFWRQVQGLAFVLMTAAAAAEGLHVVTDDAAVTAGTLRIAGADDDVDDVTIAGVMTGLKSATTAGKGAWVYLNLPR